MDFLPASLATIVSYFSAEITRGVWKPVKMDGKNWPNPEHHLELEAEIKEILASAGVQVSSSYSCKFCLPCTCLWWYSCFHWKPSYVHPSYVHPKISKMIWIHLDLSTCLDINSWYYFNWVFCHFVWWTLLGNRVRKSLLLSPIKCLYGIFFTSRNWRLFCHPYGTKWSIWWVRALGMLWWRKPCYLWQYPQLKVGMSGRVEPHLPSLSMSSTNKCLNLFYLSNMYKMEHAMPPFHKNYIFYGLF